MGSTETRRRSEDERHGEHAHERSEVVQDGDRIGTVRTVRGDGPVNAARERDRADAQPDDQAGQRADDRAETANGPTGRSRAEQRAAAQAKAGAEVVATAGERDPGMAKLAEFYFRHTPLEELAAAAADQLMAAVRAHYQLAEHRAPGRPAIRVRDG